MSSVYSIGSMNQLADALAAAGFSPDDVTKLRQADLATILQVLRGTARIVREFFKLACDKPFNPAEFLGEGWGVWKGRADGDGMTGEEDRDTREDGLSVIDWDQVFLETHLQERESLVNGEEKLKRAISGGNIQLGGKAFLSLWEGYQANRENSVLEKLRLKGVSRIYFFGLRLRDPGGDRYVLSLCFSGSGWRWDYDWLGYDWHAYAPSASLASN